jgi:hypothetical protein
VDYGYEYNILFNGSVKYEVASLSSNPTFAIQGQHIEYVSQWLHQGHIITNNNDDSEDIISRRNTLCNQMNKVICFQKRHPLTKLELLISYCCSFYGLMPWDLSNLHIESFCRTLRKGLRRAVWTFLLILAVDFYLTLPVLSPYSMN